MESCLSDLRHSLRILRQSPSFTIAAVAALAVGIAANTAIFTVVNTVILRPLPFADSGRIVSIARAGGGTAAIPMFTYWERHNPGFEDMAAYLPGSSMNLNGGDKPEVVAATRTSRNYFRLFGANPIVGRTFTAEEDQPGGPRVLAMSYGLWQSRFGGDPSILKRTIRLGGAPYTVVGVLSPGFIPYPSADVWMPLEADPESTDQAHVLLVCARLPRGLGLAQANAQMAVVGSSTCAHYFECLRIPLLAGRLLRDREAGRTVVISQTMARKYWPNASPVGQTIVVGPGLGPGYDAGVTEIVGVAGDVRWRLDVDPAPVMYQAPSQVLDGAMALVNRLQPGAVLIRTRAGVAPMSVSHAVQQALLAADQLPVAKTRTMEQASLDSTARQNFNLLLLGLFAAIALLLAAMGIYGVMSYSVEQRTHEIGIRTALGASRRDTLNLVLFQALRMTVAGLAVGVAAAFGLTRLLNAQLFGVKPSDPLTFIAVPAILLVVALVAACIPALRASRVDPLVALRHE